MRTGVVCGIAPAAGGAASAEVVVRLCQEQWLVAQVDAVSLAAWCLSLGQPVRVDTSAAAVSIQPLPSKLAMETVVSAAIPASLHH